MVDPDAPSPNLIPQVIGNNYTVSSIKCFSTAGHELSDAEKMERLACPVPVLIVSGVENIHPYFSRMLRPDAIIIVEPRAS